MDKRRAHFVIPLDICGLGIILYSPHHVQHIEEGSDYFSSNYVLPGDVQSHIQKGTLVGFSTSSPGRYFLRFRSGYPEDAHNTDCEFKLRLGLRCVGGKVCVRDLYDLMQWTADCPEAQSFLLPDGYYHVTLCSGRPESGLLGDNQVIDVYLQKLDGLPRLADLGVPILCE